MTGTVSRTVNTWLSMYEVLILYGSSQTLAVRSLESLSDIPPWSSPILSTYAGTTLGGHPRIGII